MEYDGETLVIDRTPSELDEMVLEFTEILDEVDIEYVSVSGYVAKTNLGTNSGRILPSDANSSSRGPSSSEPTPMRSGQPSKAS